MKFTFAPESKPLDGFTIKRAIQRGGFGEVYYALSDAGKEVALKLVQHNMDIELRGVRQCLNLKHPNLVTIFDIRTDDDGDHWIVMEYVAGKCLDRVLADYPDGMPVEEVQRWLNGIAAGMNYLHDRGLVHRDLKPANIYSESGAIKVGDVGLSKFISPSRRSAHSESVGTVYYMAPEIARGRYGREVDVYSLGVILYEMLTGRVPFDGETTAEILMKHLSEKPDLTPISARLRPVLARALEKDVERRTASVEQLEREFRNAVIGVEFESSVRTEQKRDTTPMASASGRCEPAGSNSSPSSGLGTRSLEAPASTKKAEHSTPPFRDRSFETRPEPPSHENGQRYSHARPVGSPWEHHDRRWLWYGAGFLVLLAVTTRTPVLHLIGHSIRAVFVVGVLGALGYAGYRMAHFGVTTIGRVFGSRRKADRSRRVQSVGFDGSGAGVVDRARHRGFRVVTARGRPSVRLRMTELTGAMLLAVVCTGIITAGLHLLTGFLPEPDMVGLFGMTTLLASWGVLIPAKLWEGTRIENGLKRLILMGAGCLVGVLAYGADYALLVDLPSDPFNRAAGIFDRVGRFPLLESVTEPTLAGYIVFFGALFSLRRWWRNADAFRAKRFRVASLLMSVVVAYIVTILWAFPQGWGLTWAAAISSVVQLSSAWVPPEQRAAAKEGRQYA